MNDFYRSFEQLRRDDGIVSLIVFGVVTLLVAAASMWLFRGRVIVYVATETARLEAVTRVFPLDAAASGRVKANHLKLGAYVHQGEVLAEFDAEGLRKQIDADRVHLKDLEPERARIAAAIDAEQQAMAAAHRTDTITLREAQVRSQGAEDERRVAQEISDRYKSVQGVVSYIEVLRVQAEAQAKATEATNQQLEVERLERDFKTQQSDREASIEQLNRERVKVEGEIDSTKAEIKRLEYETTKALVRAPVEGRVASVSDLEVGKFVHEGDRIGSIIPRVKIRGVAEFSAFDALGRIHSGQRAWLHLSGFPWMEFGSVPGTVAGVAAEPSDGRIRVELNIDSASAPLIPIEHGLPGTAEVATEQVAPITLLLRSAGQLLIKPAPSDHGQSGSVADAL